MSNKQANRAGTIRQFEIFQAKDGGESIDASPAVTDIKYYENVLSPSVNLTVVIAETGESDKKTFGSRGMLNGLPIRGGNASHIIIEDHEGCLLYTSPSPRDS